MKAFYSSAFPHSGHTSWVAPRRSYAQEEQRPWRVVYIFSPQPCAAAPTILLTIPMKTPCWSSMPAPSGVYVRCSSFCGPYSHSSSIFHHFVDNYHKSKHSTKETAEDLATSDLTFLGIVAISDPVREEVPDAIKNCNKAGINVKIVTGDTSGTAQEIGRQIGIWNEDDTDQQIITGIEFDELSDGIEGVLDLLEEPGREGFTQSLERLCTQMQLRKTSIEEVIDNQLFNHLEHDILGKMKISSLKTRIRRRTRILQKY